MTTKMSEQTAKSTRRFFVMLAALMVARVTIAAECFPASESKWPKLVVYDGNGGSGGLDDLDPDAETYEAVAAYEDVFLLVGGQ